MYEMFALTMVKYLLFSVNELCDLEDDTTCNFEENTFVVTNGLGNLGPGIDRNGKIYINLLCKLS